jgi:hypothetical protein
MEDAMNTILHSTAIRMLVLLLAASVTFAQALVQDRVPFRQAELDQMLAPVALYPDALLSQVLMASTYPLEVVQAARWSRANPGQKGQDAVRAVELMDWDPSVKSLTAFPQILSIMDEKLEWTQRLGEAFLAQQADVLDTVQALRRRAEAAGNLRSSEQMRVERQSEVITLHQPAPEVVYVPYYNPVVVYGTWWWPAYPPVYWAPPAYYYVPAHRPAFLWGPRIWFSASFFFGQPDWHRRHVTVVRPYYAPSVYRAAAPANVPPTAWRHEPRHRRDMISRNGATRDLQPAGATPAIRTEARPGPTRSEPRPAIAPVVRAEALPVPRPAIARPESRPAPAAPVVRSEPRHEPRPAIARAEPRPAPAAPVVRSEPRHEPRPAIARAESRPAPAAPVVRPEPRHEPRPAIARAESRPAPAAPVVRPEPRHEPRPAARAEHRPEPRPAANAGRHVPRQ